MLKKVRLQLITERREAIGSLFDGDTPTLRSPNEIPEEDVEHMEITVEANYHDDGTRISMTYHESELTGMAGATTSISFNKNDAGLVSMLRHGTVKTALVFEKGKRHTCVYETPIMPFEICVLTSDVVNAIEAEGTLTLDYTVELRGAAAEHTHFNLRVLPFFDKPIGR